ncbi:MAG: hypothetical protein Ct9H90mP25_0240 [Gammaproteobacteria bacterium]|nr:MAG: hypothetical protein Ct9H90mP25_0240 [Gammaproteobacteria bacterium]
MSSTMKLAPTIKGNFAPAGNIVGTVPSGTGLMVLANDNIEIFGNIFNENNSANILVVSYYITERPFDDPNYDPFPEYIHIHENQFNGGGHPLTRSPLRRFNPQLANPFLMSFGTEQ